MKTDCITQKQELGNHPTIPLTLAPPVLLETLKKPSKQFLVQSDVLLVYPKRDVQVSYSHLWVQAGRAVSSAYTLPKWEPSLMFATFLDASAPILGRGITRLVPEPVFCGVSPAPWHLQHFLVEPQQEIFMPEDSTLASLS